MWALRRSNRIASSLPCWINIFFSLSLTSFFFCLIRSFSWSYFFSSESMRLNSSAEMLSSFMALEMWSDIVFSFDSARTRISLCFLAFARRRRATNLLMTATSPQTPAAASKPTTTGAAITVERRPIPDAPSPRPTAARDVSTPSQTFSPLWYFLYRAALFSFSFFRRCSISLICWSR